MSKTKLMVFAGFAVSIAAVSALAAQADNNVAVSSTVIVVATSTMPHMQANIPPMLDIGPSGEFHARGMTVTSVASGSFQGSVWGITYTINWSGNNTPEFLLNKENNGKFISPSTQLVVGDIVAVSGKVSTSSPLVVTAQVVRDNSIMMMRPDKNEGQGNGQDENKGGHGFMPMMNGSTTVSSSIYFQGRLNDLLNQLRMLQGSKHGDASGSEQ